MPYDIPSFTKILMYFGNSTIFVLVGALYLWICYGARRVHFTVSLERKGALFFLQIPLYNHQKDSSPCLWLYYGKVIVELKKKTQTTKKT